MGGQRRKKKLSHITEKGQKSSLTSPNIFFKKSPKKHRQLNLETGPRFSMSTPLTRGGQYVAYGDTVRGWGREDVDAPVSGRHQVRQRPWVL